MNSLESNKFISLLIEIRKNDILIHKSYNSFELIVYTEKA